MKQSILKTIALITCGAFISACTTAQINQGLAIAEPIAAAAAGAAANSYAPGSGALATAAVNSIWGAYQQAQAGQPVEAGAVNPTIGAAIASAIPAGTSQTTTITALATAAGLVPSVISKTATTGMFHPRSHDSGARQALYSFSDQKIESLVP